MKIAAACLALLFLGSAFAQAPKPGAQESARDRAVKRCNDNRGTDCKTEQGLRPWMEEEGPMTYQPHVRPKPTQLPAQPAKPSTVGSKP